MNLYHSNVLLAGSQILFNELNTYLKTDNYGFPRRNYLLKTLFLSFPEFIENVKIFRAIRTSDPIIRGEYAGGCSSEKDINNFLSKRFGQGYDVIYISHKNIKALNLNKLIFMLNEVYDANITERYLDEKEYIFNIENKKVFYKKNIKEDLRNANNTQTI